AITTWCSVIDRGSYPAGVPAPSGPSGPAVFRPATLPHGRGLAASPPASCILGTARTSQVGLPTAPGAPHPVHGHRAWLQAVTLPHAPVLHHQPVDSSELPRVVRHYD